jgi:hypothetical protein
MKKLAILCALSLPQVAFANIDVIGWDNVFLSSEARHESLEKHLYETMSGEKSRIEYTGNSHVIAWAEVKTFANKTEGNRIIFKMSCQATSYNGDITPSVYSCTIDSSDYIGQFDSWAEPAPGGEMLIRTRKFDIAAIADQGFVKELSSALQALGGVYERSEYEYRGTDDQGTYRYDYSFKIDCPSETQCVFEAKNSVKPELGN